MSELQPVLDAPQMDAAIRRMADAVAGLLAPAEKPAIVGIRTHGVTLAQRIRRLLLEERALDFPLGILDITLYRDDFNTRNLQPIVRPSEIDFDLTGCTVVLLDDVLYTGRTIRCALDQLMDYGRPQAIRLGVLVDRGCRELPIQPDFVGERVATEPEEKITVRFREIEGEDAVGVARKAPSC